jgi:DNA ligase 1
MHYHDVVLLSKRLATTSKRTEKIACISELLARSAPSEIGIVVGLLVGEPMQGRIGVGWASVRDHRGGDAPSIPSVTLAEIDTSLSAVAQTLGTGSQRERDSMLGALFRRLTLDERDHLIRVITGELRQGANEGIVSDAAAKAAGVSATDLRRATMLLGSLGAAIERALTGQTLHVGLTPLVAVQPMLAATSASASDALVETGPASVEWKLDGIRLQAHKLGDEVRLYTRGLNEISANLPAIVEIVRGIDLPSVVLDGECIGIDEQQRPRRFQDTMSGLSTSSVYFFDVMHADGLPLIDAPLVNRKRTLESILPSDLLLPSLETNNGDDANRFAEESIAAGHEGVVVKALDSLYQAGRRGSSWRKVKPVHTLDLVVLAAEWGHGRRTGWLSNIHLGARTTDGFVMVGKTFKGMTDVMLQWQTEAFQAIALATDSPPNGPRTLWVRPELVVEIAVDGVQVSRKYPGGVALRFARVKRYRTDKVAASADTIDRVRTFLN